ncbi:hypothetical protein L2X99_07465 [Microbacterium sp. KUDC0406]|uniref:hypothetical protein n=1 Tax=Microbacterium sp. KUDC0406 TaxID=2909588 RepID=UPI001F2FA936|nr:hypothetical protein [Microbacterium sp. KUDC0406]UJP11347.1 hypothetical protein L2X99_07465 [Microbacterium sp. KUDC0406]
MYAYLLLACAPLLVALVVAVLWRFTAMRSIRRFDRRTIVTTVLAGAIPVAVMTLTRLSFWLPSFLPPFDRHWSAWLPLVLGMLAVALLSIPPRAARTPATADLSRRTVLSVVPVTWVITLLVLAVVIVAITLAAGAASEPDEFGHHTRYTIRIGSAAEMSSEIYGWYYSVPALLALGALLLLTAIVWMLIPRRPWDDDRAADAAVRRLRAANIGRTTAGAMLVHLSFVLQSLYGTSQMSGMAASGDLGQVTVGTSFAALGPALLWASEIALAAGLSLWMIVALTAVPAGVRRPAPAFA